MLLRSPHAPRLAAGLLTKAFMVTAIGCGSSGPVVAPVQGKVTWNGEPLPNVLVEFQPVEKGSPAVGYTDDAGRYKLRFSRDKWGATPGTHTVRINHDWEKGSDAPRPTFRIPAKYHSKTELKGEVGKGSNTLDFALVGPVVQASPPGRVRR